MGIHENTLNILEKNGHKEWSFSWNWLPSDNMTPDGAPGRDGIKALIDGTAKTLIVYEASGSSNTYTVFVTDYQENLLRRDIQNQRSFWDVTLSLKEA
jgi:hypothetical protein